MKQKLINLKALLCLLLLLVGVNASWAETVTYNVTGKAAVSTSGTVPQGSSASYSQTYGTAKQMTKGNSTTLTLSGFDGCTITGVTISTKTNASSGAGSFTVTIGGTQKGSLSVSKLGDTYINKDITVTSTEVGSGETIVIGGSCTTNSLYCESYTITYTASGKTALGTPANLSSSNVTGSSATLSWDAVSNASSYKVKIGSTEYDTNTNSYNATGLEAETTYNWSVKALAGTSDTYGDGIYSGVASFTTGAFVATAGTYNVSMNNTLYGVSAGSNGTEQSKSKYGVTIVSGCQSNASNKTYYDSNHIRYYSSSYLKLTAPTGFKITQVVFTANGTWSSGPSASVGTYTNSTKTWTGSAEQVDFSFSDQNRVGSIAITYAADKVLQSVAVSGTPTKTTYEAGDSFDPTGLTVTGTYDQGDPEAITEGITWSTPAALTAGQTSVDITATVNGVTSPSFTVTGLTVNAAKATPTLTISGNETSIATDETDEFSISYNGDGQLSVTSGTPSVASVVLNGTTVKVTPNVVGTSVITISATEGTNYKSAETSYTLNVTAATPKGISGIRNQITSISSSNKSTFYATKLTDAVVTYVGNSNTPTIYVEDANAGIVIYAKNTGLEAGSVINGTVSGEGVIYQGLTEITTIDLSNATITTGGEIPCHDVTIAELNSNINNWESRRIKISNATVSKTMDSEKNRTAEIAQSENTITVYEKIENCMGSTLDIEGTVINTFIGYAQDQTTSSASYNEFCVWAESDIVLAAKENTTVVFDCTDGTGTAENPVAFTIGDENTFPTAVVKDSEGNPLAGASVKYSTTNGAYINVNEATGVLELIKYASKSNNVKVTATYAGDATHNGNSAEYYLTIAKGTPVIAFAENSLSVPADATNAGLKVTVTKGENLTITYSSSDETVASFADANSHVLTLHKAGKATITAQSVANDAWKQSESVTYELTVTEALEVIYTITLKSCGNTISGGNTSIEVQSGNSTTLPSVSTTATGYTFKGWSTTEQKEETNTCPTLVDNTYSPTADVTLYPIFDKTTGGTQDFAWALVDYNSIDTRDPVVIVVSNESYSRCVTTDNGETYLKGVDVTVDNGVITSTIQDNYKWTTWTDDSGVGFISSDGRYLNSSNVKSYPYDYWSLESNGTKTYSMKNLGSANGQYLTLSGKAFTMSNTAADSKVQFYQYSIAEVGGSSTYTSYPLGEMMEITLNPACHDTDGMVYGTFSSSKAFYVPAEIIVAEIGIVDNALNVDEYDEGDLVPANRGLMISAEQGGTYYLPVENDQDMIDEFATSKLGADNCLHPTGDEPITAYEMSQADPNCTYYRLTMHNKTQIGYWWGAENGAAFALGANKAYLAVSSSSSVKASFWIGNNDATVINSVSATLDENAPVYNLSGQRVSHTTKGIVIQNGKKFINK